MAQVFSVENPDGSCKETLYNHEGFPILSVTMLHEELHSFNGLPSLTKYEDKCVKHCSLHNKGKLHISSVVHSSPGATSTPSVPGASHMSYYIVDPEKYKTHRHVMVTDYKGINQIKYTIGPKKTEKWHVDDLLHSINDKPAYIRYRFDGSVYKMKWYNKGQVHRENGPACIIFDKKGYDPIGYLYYENGKLLRVCTPTRERNFL